MRLPKNSPSRLRLTRHGILGQCFPIVILLFIGLDFCPGIAQNAIVDQAYDGNPGALVDGIPRFASIGEALTRVPEENSAPFLIFIEEGRYYEKLRIDRPLVHLVGANAEKTVISYDASADAQDPEGRPYGTSGSYTLQIAAPDFKALNLTIENSFDYPENAKKPDDDASKVKNPQAVAVMVAQGSDRAVFCGCIIRGYQDTLFADAGRQFYHGCRILGHVDFIFGAGQAVFENCEIVSRNRMGKNPTGYIAAPSTSIAHPYGFLFFESRLLKESSDLMSGSVRLGRPWHPGADPRVKGNAVFYRCFMDDHIGEKGYARISSRDAAGERIWFQVGPDSRFFEYRSHGPGAITSDYRPELDDQMAAWYSPAQVLNGWIPDCGH